MSNNAYYRKVNMLNNYNNLLKEIDDLTCDYCELLTKATKINQTLRDDVSPANHDNESKVENMTILLAQKKDEIVRACMKRDRINAALEKLSVRDRYLIQEVDINGRSINSTSKNLRLNYEYAITLHHKVINKMNF